MQKECRLKELIPMEHHKIKTTGIVRRQHRDLEPRLIRIHNSNNHRALLQRWKQHQKYFPRIMMALMISRRFSIKSMPRAMSLISPFLMPGADRYETLSATGH